MRALRAAAAALALAAAGASAQVLINPVVVDFAPAQRVATITLTLAPGARRTVAFQAGAMRWRQDAGGESRHEPDDGIVVVPPVFELRPGQSQRVRVGLRAARPGPQEQAWRLVFEELPAADDVPGGAVSFRMRYDLPVMLAPSQPAREQIEWERCDGGERHLCVRAANSGNRRVTLRSLDLSGSGWAVTLDEPVTLLAGTRREWRLPRPPGSAGEVRTVSARTNRPEPIVAQLP